MNSFEEKDLVNLSTQRLLEMKKKLVRVIAAKNFDMQTTVEFADADYKYLRNCETQLNILLEVLSSREHLDRTRDQSKTRRREKSAVRDMKRKAQ